MCVVGAGNSAGQAVLHLAKWAEMATLVVRGPTLAKHMSKYLIEEIEAAANVAVLLSTQVVGGSGDGRLETLTLADNVNDNTSVVPADAVFALIGAQPHTAWLPPAIARDGHGFVVTGAELTHDGLLDDWLLPRSPRTLEDEQSGCLRRRRHTLAFDEARCVGRRRRDRGRSKRSTTISNHNPSGRRFDATRHDS